MALRLPPGMATYVPTSWALHPVGARVWLPKERRYGRVIARAQGGLLYRIRPEGTEREPLLERSTCELVTVSEGWLRCGPDPVRVHCEEAGSRLSLQESHHEVI